MSEQPPSLRTLFKASLRAPFRAAGFDIVRRPRAQIPARVPQPIGAIPCPLVDIKNAANPIPQLLQAADFAKTVAYFARCESGSLLSPDAQALLFAFVRNLRPEHVVEIGTFRGGTSEAICRALHANGRGILHTIEPSGATDVMAILERWPDALRRHVRFHAMNSMEFFGGEHPGLRPSLIFIDGNHDYEYAAFDVRAASRLVNRGGFLFIDNISQFGPYMAARELLRDEPGWNECGERTDTFASERPFDAERTTIHNTDLMVLRAPRHFLVGARPMTTGQMTIAPRRIEAIELDLAAPAGEGRLSVQMIMRTVGRQQLEHIVAAQARPQQHGPARVDLTPPFTPVGDVSFMTVEIWLSWDGNAPLALTRPPRVL